MRFATGRRHQQVRASRPLLHRRHDWQSRLGLLVRSSGVTDYRLVEDTAEVQVLGRPVDAGILLYLRETEGPQSAQAISEALNLSKQSTRNRLTARQRLVKIQPEGKDGHAALYALKETSPIPA